MPKDRADYRVARAALSAPYPLPIIITRAQGERPPTPHPEVSPDTNQDQAEIIYLNGFPYNPRWKERRPAIEPIPYPPADDAEKERRKVRREWKIRLRRERRAKRGGVAINRDTDGDYLMSGIEEGPSYEGTQVTDLGNLTFGPSPSIVSIYIQ